MGFLRDAFLSLHAESLAWGLVGPGFLAPGMKGWREGGDGGGAGQPRWWAPGSIYRVGVAVWVGDPDIWLHCSTVVQL